MQSAEVPQRVDARGDRGALWRVPQAGHRRAAAGDHEIEDYLHVYLANRGILITPFHSMALMCPATTDADVDRHTEVFTAALSDLHS